MPKRVEEHCDDLVLDQHSTVALRLASHRDIHDFIGDHDDC